MVNRIAAKFNPDKIIQFGSYAAGTPDENSDLDLLIIKDSDLPRHKRSFEIRKFLIGSKIPMDALIYTHKEFNEEMKEKFSFISGAIKNSKVLYERYE
jgi:uncharacterized protein